MMFLNLDIFADLFPITPIFSEEFADFHLKLNKVRPICILSLKWAQ